MVKTLQALTTEFVKLDKFDGGNFRRWQKKVRFLLLSLCVDYVLNVPKPSENDDETPAQIRKRVKWTKDDEICKGHILNALSDNLFDVYQNMETAKELWETLNNRYLTEDATSKKFLASHFMNYKMVDAKSVTTEFDEIQCILGQMKLLNMNMDECIGVSCIIDKLPPSWKDVKKNLKHKKQELTLKDLGKHLQIEEGLREKNDSQEGQSSKVHMTEEMNTNKLGQSNEKKSGQAGNKRKWEQGESSKNPIPSKKKKVSCYNCRKPGHFKRECRFFKKRNGNKD